MTQGTTKGVPIDTDATLSANSNQLVASQAAVKSYVDAQTTTFLTGDVTGNGTSNIVTTISSGAVTLAKQAPLAATSVIGNATGSSATPSAVSFSTLRSNLGIAGSTRVVYVRPDGIDGAPNDGSEGLPYATVGYAMTQITTASASNPHVINVAGQTTETTIALKPYVSVTGDGVATLNISGSLTLDSTYLSASGSSRATYSNLVITGIAGVTLDFTGGTSAPFLWFESVVSPTMTVIGSGTQIMRFYEVEANLIVSDISTVYFFNCSSPTLSITNNTTTFKRAHIVGTFISGSLTIKTTSSGLQLAIIRGCPYFANWTLDGTQVGADVDLFTAAPTLLNGASYFSQQLIGSIKGTSNGGIVWSDASKLNILAGTATANLPLLSGASATPSWSSISYLTSATTNALVYASSATALGTINTANNSVLVTSGAGVPSLSTTLPSGLAMQTPASLTLTNATGLPLTTGVTGILGLTNGGTAANLTASNGGIVYSGASALAILAGVAAAGRPLLSGLSAAPTWSSFALSLGGALTTAGALTTSGAFPLTLTTTASTSVTLPTSGILATTAQLPTPAALTAASDTNVTLALGGTPATALLQAASITAGWTGQLAVTRGGTGLSGTTANQLLYSSATNTIAGLATANNGVLVTSGAGVPSLSTTLPTGLAMQTPASITLSNATGLPLTTGVTGTLGVTNGGTGLSSTTVNQLLYSSATNTIAGLATVNSAYLTTSAGGVPTWVAGSPMTSIVTTVFTISGTWTPNSAMKAVRIRMVAGGGQGGGCAGIGANQASAGAGGGAGSYTELVATVAQIGTGARTVTIGAAGQGAATGAAGNAGGATSITGVATTSAGQGGAAGTSVTSSFNIISAAGTSAAGTITIGTGLALWGRYGTHGHQYSFTNPWAIAGWGGVSLLGGIQGYASNQSGGGAGSPAGYGNGGGAVINVGGGAAIAGGIGSAGVVIIEEYI